ncbi:MAG: PBSX family phage terminase large subunit [Lachnospiraceae bacterium]|nr:PBSX family phage terminase large subunit [Lachnospiraceae bacterium]MCM1233012.1 PBSX family phage terminase large subunit [Ruminococcus flavefaciens]
MIEWKPFSPKALDFIRNSDARLNIMYGSVRSSKTVNSTVRWIDYMLSGPEGDLAMFGKTTATLQRNVLNDLFDIVGPANYKWLNRQQGELRIFNRRVYTFGANNEDAESKIRGATFAGALCDEVNLYPQSVFNQLMARLSVAGAMCFANCNPDSPYHWFNTDYILNEDITDKKVWKFLMDDNLSLDPDYVRSLKQMYKGVWYDRMINGDWVAAEGRVYDMYEPKKHKIDTNAAILKSGVAPAAIRWFVGCDYGTSTVMSWGLYAKLPDGTVYKVREYYWDAPKQQFQKTDSQFADEFVRWLSGIIPAAVYVDPSAASWKLELMRRGFRVLNADNDVLNGVRYVGSQLSLDRFFIDQTCTNTDLEYVSYAWDPAAQLKGIDKPLKVHDHACDTDRYALYTDSQGALTGVYTVTR